MVLCGNQFSTKSWYTILCNFFIPEIFRKKGPPRSSFGTVRQRSFERKSWYHPPSHNNSDKRKFLKIEGFPYKILRYCERINFRQSRDTPLMQFFYSRKFLKKRVLLGALPVLWDKKVSRESRDIPLLAIKISDKRKLLKDEGFPYKILRYCERINFRQSRDTPLMQFS